MRTGQLSLFGAGVQPVSVWDLEGILCGPGQLSVRQATARLSVVVPAGWRVTALLAEFAERSLPGEVGPVAGTPREVAGAPAELTADRASVRTGFDPRLGPLAVRWSGGAGKRVPSDLTLDGARLRLWCLAAGAREEQGWRLGLGPNDPDSWQPVGAALAAAGLTAALVGPRATGAAYRLTGARRLGRLAELVGPPPAGCPVDGWPG